MLSHLSYPAVIPGGVDLMGSGLSRMLYLKYIHLGTEVLWVQLD